MHYLVEKQIKKSCDTCAYQESGHVVAAYLSGYHCREMQIMDADDEDGMFSYALLDYGKDEPVALQFIGEKGESGFFKKLTLADRLESIEVGQRLARIFIGGSVASAVYRNKGDAHIPFPLQMDYLDLQKVESIHAILRELTANHEVDFLENEIANALYTISNPYIWESIDQLAKQLIRERYLSKNDIEECLEKTGLLPLFA